MKNIIIIIIIIIPGHTGIRTSSYTCIIPLAALYRSSYRRALQGEKKSKVSYFFKNIISMNLRYTNIPINVIFVGKKILFQHTNLNNTNIQYKY